MIFEEESDLISESTRLVLLMRSLRIKLPEESKTKTPFGGFEMLCFVQK